MSEAVAGVVPDPFALHTHVLHPVLSRNQLCGSEYDPPCSTSFSHLQQSAHGPPVPGPGSFTAMESLAAAK
jgi:hypothetical protein